MALQDILQKILQEAQKQIVDIEKEFNKEAEILKEESKKIEKEEAFSLNKRKNETLEKLSIETETMARREHKKIIAFTNNTIINDSLTHFVEHLTKLSDEDYSVFLKKIFEGIDVETGEVFVSPDKISVFSSVVPKKFTVKKDDSVSSGFIFKSKGLEIDNTFETLVFSEFRSDLESFFAQKLGLI